jgi:hypothetical protein
LEPLKDAAGFREQRLRLLLAALRTEPLGVLEPGDGYVEGDSELL